MENEQENKKTLFSKKYIIAVILFLFLAGGVFIFLKNQKNKPSESAPAQTSDYSDAFKTENEESDEASENMFAEKDNLIVEEAAVSSASENYKINRVSFGGSVALTDDLGKDLLLEIYDIKSEIVSSPENEEPKFLLSWKTNKATIAEVIYAIDSGDNPKKFKENSYALDHSAVLEDIELSTIYVYKIIARDRWGNEKESEYFSMYTGEKTASVFDLIVSSIEDTFSWMMKK